MSDEIAVTRRAWHGVAEQLLAGPQYRRSGTIRLRVTPGGFGTIADPAVRVEGTELVTPAGTASLAGTTIGQLAAESGLDAGPPAGLYTDGSGVRPDELLQVDPAAAKLLADALTLGDAALRRFAPSVTPVLWPEHFDLGISVDEVNYGVSLGDTYLAEPYAYVGPHQPRADPFFNAPFGAARALTELPEIQSLLAFFAEGRLKARAA